MRDKTIKLILKVLAYSIEANKKEEYQVFFEFSGHVNWIELRVMESGETQERIYNKYSLADHDREKDLIKDLNEMLEFLTKIILPNTEITDDIISIPESKPKTTQP